ncbi:MAG TPA: hypothetical protein VEK82_03295 [Stellaceae bacterium]|nr:hypothetical protein [Stellaceae bacterium]
MPKIVRKAPRFEKLLSSNRDLEKRTVSLRFGDHDEHNYEIELDLQAVPVSIFALANEYGRILSSLPAEERPAVQPIQGTGIVPALGPDGTPALILRLEGGGELTIKFSKDAIAEVSEKLTELLAATQTDRYH